MIAILTPSQILKRSPSAKSVLALLKDCTSSKVLCTHCIAIQSIVIQSTPSKGLSSNTAIGDGWMLFEEKREKEKRM
jgi:hypothetical protein